MDILGAGWVIGGSEALAASLNRILELVQDRPREGRDLLFRHVCDLFFNGPLPKSDTDRRNLVEILEILRPQVAISLRRELAGRLYSMEQPPEALLRLALGDIDEVAGPVIDYAALPESLILELAQSAPVALRRRLARRRDLSPRAQHALDQSLEPAEAQADAPDIDLRGEVETALRAAAADSRRLQDYSRSACDWTFECDRKGRLTFLSDGAITAFGRPASVLLGLHLDDLCVEGESRTLLRQRLDGWRAFDDLAVTIEAAGDGPREWLLRAVPVFDFASGRFQGFRGAAELKPAVNPTPAAAVETPPPAEAVSDLLGELGHELKTPLNAILGFSEIMELGTFGPVGPEYARMIEHMRKAGQQVDDLVSDILENARSRPADAAPVRAEIAADELVERAIRRVTATAERHRLAIAAIPLPIGVTLLTDPEIAEYCLARLLRCAIAAEPGGERITLRLAACADGGLDIHVPCAPLSGARPAVAAREMIQNHRIDEAGRMARRIGGVVRRTDSAVILSLPTA